MGVGEVISKVLRILLMCLIAGSTLGWFPSLVNASSTAHLLDSSIDSSPSQTRATQTSPIASQPVSSPANGTWEVTGTIQLSGTERPLQIAISGGKAFVSRNPGHLTVVDLSTNTVVTTISFDPYPGAAPHYIGISGDKAYVALGNLGSDGQLAVINIANNTVAGYIPVGADPYGVTTLGQQVYVTNNVWWSSGDPATVKVVDVNTNSVVATIPVGINPTSVAVDPATRKAYVANHNDLSKSVSVIDTTTNSVTATIPINNPPAGVAISGTRAYVSTTVNMPNGTVEVIDIGSDTVVSSIPVGRDSWGIAASDSYIFVANQSSSTVSVIEVATNSVVATVNVGDDPTHIAVDPSTNRVYVTNQGDRTISIIEFIETPQPSNEPPTVSIESPLNNAAVSGTVDIQGTASDPDGNFQLQRVEVKIDTGTWVQASGTTSWSYSWDTTTVPDGQHSIYARSYDGQAYSDEESIAVNVNNVAPTPSLVDVGISSEAEAWPPKTFLQAEPGDRINTWYRISYAGSLIRVKLKTTIFDPNGSEIDNPLNDPFLQIEGPTEDTGWVGVTFEIPDEAILGTYDVRFSVWSEDGTQEYDAVVKPGWLSLDGAIHTGTIEVTSDPSGASFTLSGPANYSGATPWSKTDAPVGTYTITWTLISSYQIPPQESKTLVQGGAISFYGPYQSGRGTIEVTSNPSGASFTLSGPANYSGITPWSEIDAPVGTYTITWTPISSYQTPPQESKTLTQGGTISFYGPYQSGKGTIEVTSNPSGASFTLSGPTNYSGITPWSKTDAPVGTYTITWAPISGYQTPAQESKVLTQDGTISFYGPYQSSKGTIEVTSDPSGASFTLSGLANYSGITTWSKTDAPVGTYTITWAPISGYQTPAQESKTLTQGGTISFHGPYQLGKGTIEVASDPSGASFTLSGPANYSGITLWSKTDAPVGTYTVTWGFMSGYDTPSQETKTLIQGGMVSFYSRYTAMEAFPGANAVTLWDYYSAWGKEWPPLGERAKMYEALGLGSADSYAGTAEQNTRLLNALKQRQICPSTGEEVGWVAPTTTIAQLIEQETMERIPVTVDGQQYFIVTLTRRIDVNSLEIVPGSSATKVYVEAQGNPVSNRDLAQKIGVIDSSRRWAEGAGSASNIFQNIDGMRSRWAIHRQIKWLGFSLELLPATAAISVRAYFTTGASIPEDILSTASKMFLAHASNPGWVLENIALGNFSEAEEEYRKAMELAGSTGGPRDYKTASAYFKHLFNAYANDYSAWQLLNQIDRIDKKTLEELADLGGHFSAGLVGMNYGLFETLMDSLRALPLTSSYFGIWDQWRSNYENIVSELNYHARYTLALARKDPALMKGVGSEELWTVAKVGSPVELRVYDSQGRVTGMLNGEVRSEIPNSSYYDNAVTILFPSDSYSYEVSGTSEGSYDLVVTTIAERTNTFTLSDVPTSASVVHQYTIDWGALSKGQKGVTMKIDADGDGTFEDIKYLGQKGIGFSWVWIVVVGLSALLGVLVGAFLVWRRIGRKQAA